jgi:tripartite-type tricarboxylate transporter receptor subunit TctC
VIALTQLNSLAGTRIVDVPYRGSGQAAAAVPTGAIQGTFTFYSSAKPLADDGKVRALAVSSPQRIAGWPDIPTMGELGFPGFDHRGFVGLAAPARTPAPIIAFLNKHLNEAINSGLFRQRIEALGMTIPTDNTLGELRRIHAPRNRAPGGACQALRPFSDRAEAIKRNKKLQPGRRAKTRLRPGHAS